MLFMEQSLIKETFDLLKLVKGTSSVKVTELAKELKTTSTKLMGEIMSHPKLFECVTLTEQKQIRVRNDAKWERMTGNKYSAETKYKNLGAFVSKVFLSAEENYKTDEWLHLQLRTKEKYLYIAEFDNYGSIDGYYIPIDDDVKDEYRKHLWRNTATKVKAIKERFSLDQAASWMGGYGDSYLSKPKGYNISLNDINTLKKEGWQTNDFKPLTH
jgi:hypothetical protein